MNKIIFTICALCMLCISCTSPAQVNYTIKGTANGFNEKTVYLYSAEGDITVIDSTTVSNNSFIFKGTQPKICIASVELNSMKIEFILENGTINVSFDNPGNFMYPGKANGTPFNNILNACNEKINALDDELDIIGEQMHELNEDQKDERTVLNKKLRKILNKKGSIVKKCINQNLNNIVSAYLLHTYEWMFSDAEIRKILDKASPVMKNNTFAKVVIERQEAVKRTDVGQKFIDFKLKDPNDKEIALSDYVGKRKYVLIDFWASWCGYCLKEIPYLKSAYEKYASKGFEIVGVSLDVWKENWIKCIEDESITWPQMSDLKGGESEGAKLYGIRGIPSTFLVDPNGIIIAKKGLRGDTLERKLSEIFK